MGFGEGFRRHSLGDAWFGPTVSIVCVLVALGAGFLCSFNYLDWESRLFLGAFLRDVPLATRIFDIRMTDYGIFRARELSYLFDVVDARFLQICARMGLIHFASLIHYVCLALVALLQMRLSRKYLSLAWYQNLALVLLLLLSPAPFLTGFYFRSSKVLVAFCVFCLAWLFFFVLKKSRAGASIERRVFVAMAAAVVGLAFCDEQGVMFLGIFGLAALTFWLCESRAFSRVFLVLVGGGVAYLLYRGLVGPWLIGWVTGKPLDAALQVSPVRFDVGIFGAFRGQALKLTADWIAYFYGTVSLIAAVAFGCVVWAMWPAPERREDARAYGPLLLAWVTLCLLFAANVLMTWRHQKIVVDFVKRVYYPLPVTFLLLPLTAFALDRLIRTGRLRPRVVTFGLLVVLAASLGSLPSHYRHRVEGFENEFRRSYSAKAEAMRSCIRGEEYTPDEEIPKIEASVCRFLGGK